MLLSESGISSNSPNLKNYGANQFYNSKGKLTKAERRLTEAGQSDLIVVPFMFSLLNFKVSEGLLRNVKNCRYLIWVGKF